MTPLNEQAFLHIKDMILNHELDYDRIYSETRLSKALGISRTPFRDAVHRLAQEGYIDIIPSKGFCIHRLTKKDASETFQVRSALEGYCSTQIAREAGTRKAKRLFKELDRIMEKLKEVMETSRSIPEFCEYDFQFHTRIVDYLGNEQFSTIFASFMYRMTRLAEMSLAHRGRMQETYDEHMAILDTMKAGDTAHINEVTMRHMERPLGINLEEL